MKGNPYRRQRKIVIGAAAILLLCVSSFYIADLWIKDRKGSSGKALIKSSRDQEDSWMREHHPELLTPAQLQILYKSLVENYWVPQTGVFLSFPRTGDIRLVQQAATYDQGVIGVLLLKLGDLEKVGRILTFYEKAWASAAERSGPRQGVYGLANFYNAFFSVEGIEKTMHVGPNAWIGLLASRYSRRTGDKASRDLALNIARWMITTVPHKDGAISMGQIPWNGAPWNKIFSTENNLSTYAFMSDLLKSDKLSAADRGLISRERDTIGSWLTQKAYQSQSQTVLRGFHLHGLDRAGAIDSYTWFIGALRPAYLESVGIPADALMQRASRDFTVHVGQRIGIDAVDSLLAEATYSDALKTHYKDLNFLRPSGDGHRLIWYEGTGQYIVALEDMARYKVHAAFQLPEKERAPLLQQASSWLAEAQHYTQDMDQAKLTLREGIFYPCATAGRFYLYGWPAPQPLDGHLADASASLVWRLFAGMGYEPLTDTMLGPEKDWHTTRFGWKTVRNPGTAILYGASEEMMVWAWTKYESGEFDIARRQAKATIALWEADARQLEKAKEEKVGNYLPFDGTVDSFQQIHNYWALNDVSSCYYILAEIADREGKFDEASGYLSKILREFHLAQMWDKRGWFWDPVNSIQEEFIGNHPEHYEKLAALIPSIPALTPAQEAKLITPPTQ